jgi:hypothetical protein
MGRRRAACQSRWASTASNGSNDCRSNRPPAAASAAANAHLAERDLFDLVRHKFPRRDHENQFTLWSLYDRCNRDRPHRSKTRAAGEGTRLSERSVLDKHRRRRYRRGRAQASALVLSRRPGEAMKVRFGAETRKWFGEWASPLAGPTYRKPFKFLPRKDRASGNPY